MLYISLTKWCCMPSGRAAFALVLLTGLLLGRGADDAGASAAEGAGAAFALVVLAGADEAGASAGGAGAGLCGSPVCSLWGSGF